ncbi:MAG: hypothetical protein H6727_17405 [Myxococcales bacterium]|nr:hypothetical protein [Myxococcales bacterium]
MWALLWWSMWGPGMPIWLIHGVEGRGAEIKVQTLTPYSPWQYRKTLSFLENPPRAVAKGEWLEARLWAYTDEPKLWTSERYQPLFEMARWYFSRCKIRLVDEGFRVHAGEALTAKGRLRFSMPRFRAPRVGALDTMIFLTRDLFIRWGSPTRNYRLLGYSGKVFSDGEDGLRKQRAAVWVRHSMIWTTLAHELGHRWGLQHIRLPFNLMLTGDGVRSSPKLLGTSIRGYLEPSRFRFTKKQCERMRSTWRMGVVQKK